MALSSRDKILYNTICDSIEKHQSSLQSVSVDSVEQLERAMDYVYLDHPEYFWYRRNYSYHYTAQDKGLLADVDLNFTMDKSSADKARSKIEKIVRRLQNDLSSKGEYEKVKGVYEYLINNTIYDKSYGDQSICQVLLDGRGVCSGYARSTQYLLNQLGIQAVFVEGYADGESHGWNIVRIEGDYYQLDTTWGDPVMENGTQTIIYDYFCLTQEEMYRDHFPDTDAALPVCTAVSCNYFRREGRFFAEADRDQLLELFRRDALSGKSILRAANKKTYNQLVNWLVNDGEVFDLMTEAGWGSQTGLSYSLNDSLWIISIERR